MKKLYWIAALTAALVLAPSIVLADNVHNDVVADPKIVTITAGGSATVGYFIQGLPAGADGEAGCNATEVSPATLTINAPVGVSASPTELLFTSCGTTQNVQFTSDDPGDYEITVSVDDDGIGTYNLNPATFTLRVLEAASTAPNVAASVQCDNPGNGGWCKGTITVTWTITGDPTPTLSGDCASANPTIVNTDTASTGTTLTCTANNSAGEDMESVTVFRDGTPPTVTVTGVTDGATYTLGNVPTAGCSTSDATSGVATNATVNVTGGTPAGVGTFTATCSGGEDVAGNVAANVSATYTVQYAVCVLFDTDKAKKAGSTIPVKLQLCDAEGNNVSSSSIVVQAVGLTQANSAPPPSDAEVEDSGHANPDNNFRFSDDLEGYIFNLSTKGMGQGTWWLWFTVSGDPTLHAASFALKK